MAITNCYCFINNRYSDNRNIPNKTIKINKSIIKYQVLKYKTFALTTVISVFTMISLIGPSLLMPMYMQVLEDIQLISGLLLLPGQLLLV